LNEQLAVSLKKLNDIESMENEFLDTALMTKIKNIAKDNEEIKT